MNSRQYYFDSFPLRPPLQPFESFTSYLTRVAEANGKRMYSQLKPFFGENYHISKLADYPLRSFGMLPTMTNNSESELLRTTFYHVEKKFGREYDFLRMSNFLSGVVASSLRYCPICLQEALYYSLVWRFLPLQGCPKHACHLLEQCGHCGCPIPIFRAPFHIGKCPTCDGDLRDCISSGLTEVELLREAATSRDIEFLLCPQSWETTDPDFQEKIGQEFMLHRYNKQLKHIDVIAEIGLSRGILASIELGQNGLKRATLRWYFMYARYLGVPLSHIFMNALHRREEDLRIKTTPGKYFLRSEDWVMERVREAIRILEMSGQLVTLKAITAITGITKNGLYKYDRVKAFLSEKLYYKKLSSRVCDPQFEEQLLKRAQQVVQDLFQTGKPITQQAVSDLLGIPEGAIAKYLLLKQFLDQFADHAQQIRTEECEQALLEQVRTAVMELEELKQPITYRAISEKIGINSDKLLTYAQVRAFAEQHLDSRYLQSLKEREQREEALIQHVIEALNELETAGKPVTFTSVGMLLGISNTKLKTYPRAYVLIEQKMISLGSRVRRVRGSEDEVLTDVQRSISSLIGQGERVNYETIAREMGGISAQTLKTYPKVRLLVDEYLLSDHLYQLQQFNLREEQLLSQIEVAIQDLEALGKPFSQSELCEKVGMSSKGLKRYPRVNALLKQKTTPGLRKQVEEEDIMQRVNQAVIDLTDRGEHITMNRIIRQEHLSRRVLRRYPQVILFLEQSGYKKQKPRLYREEELLNLVMEAIHICKNNGIAITQEKLSDMVGLGRNTLLRYAKVKALIVLTVSEDKQERQERYFQERQEEMIRLVVVALQHLRDQNRKITKRAIDKLVHYSRVCKRYPMVRTLVGEAIQAQRTTNGSNSD
jgi:transcriptional regulator with XRE-family HTH domain